MSSGRRAARRQAVFILYQQDLLGLTSGAAIGRLEEERIDPYARHLVLGANKEREEIDRMLDEHVARWPLERLGVLERAILRCAAFELSWEHDVPEAVAIDEAVSLAKRFCSAEAGALVNGVLGSLAASHPRPAPEETPWSEESVE